MPRSTSVSVHIIAVGDTKPHFNQDTYQGTIEEETDPGTVIVKVSMQNLFYFLVLEDDGPVTTQKDLESCGISLGGKLFLVKTCCIGNSVSGPAKVFFLLCCIGHADET